MDEDGNIILRAGARLSGGAIESGVHWVDASGRVPAGGGVTARQLDLSCAEPWCACGNRAEDCTGDRVGCIERALGDGRLSILVDPPREHDGRVPFLGDASYESTETIRVVHLMSRSARGEIRGFVITDSDNRMHWRAPQPERWVAVDRAVASALGASWSAS